MALIRCSDCGRECSLSAAACPHCGRPIGRQRQQEGFLHKVARVIFALMGLCTLAFCGFCSLISHLPTSSPTPPVQKPPVPSYTGSNPTNTLPSSSPVNLESPSAEDQKEIELGEKVYKRLQSQNGFPLMFPTWADGIHIIIPVTQSQFDTMKFYDQACLSEYARHLVNVVRQHPEPYVSALTNKYVAKDKEEFRYKPRGREQMDGSAYEALVNSCRNICQSCWEIQIWKKVRGNELEIVGGGIRGEEWEKNRH